NRARAAREREHRSRDDDGHDHAEGETAEGVAQSASKDTVGLRRRTARTSPDADDRWEEREEPVAEQQEAELGGVRGAGREQHRSGEEHGLDDRETPKDLHRPTR